MEFTISQDLIIALGKEDAEFAIAEIVSRHGVSQKTADEILEDVIINWENEHRRFPEPLTVESVLSEASESIVEADAWDEEHRD